MSVLQMGNVRLKKVRSLLQGLEVIPCQSWDSSLVLPVFKIHLIPCAAPSALLYPKVHLDFRSELVGTSLQNVSRVSGVLV